MTLTEGKKIWPHSGYMISTYIMCFGVIAASQNKHIPIKIEFLFLPPHPSNTRRIFLFEAMAIEFKASNTHDAIMVESRLY